MINKIHSKSKTIALSVFGLILFFASCKKDFEEINTDPNNPTDVPNSYYLTSAQRGLMDNTSDVWWGSNMGNQLAQYYSSNQYTSESRYFFRSGITNTYWGNFYAGGLNDALVQVGGLFELQKIVDNCKEDPGAVSAYGNADNQIAVASMLRVWLLQIMTDTWGDIPYSQALDPDNNRAPKYDKQSDIYAGLLAEVNTAIALIKEGEAGPAGDLVYGGDMTQWKKFGNALKMRIAIRMADANSSVAATAFEEAVNSGTFTSNADNALLPYGSGASGNLQYFNYEIEGRNDYCASNVFLDNTLQPLNDPRVTAWFLPATAPDDPNDPWVGELYGMDEGHGAATPNSKVSQRSDLVVSATLPGIFMDYAEVEFMMAEAVERGWTGVTNAQLHYNAGITASINYWADLNGDAVDVDAYLSQAAVDYNSAPGTWQEKIGKQKWIALFNHGTEGWSEWRRLDFGIFELPADGLLEGSGVPLRMKYAKDEQTLNSANYAAAIANQGPDNQDTKLWWDIH